MDFACRTSSFIVFPVFATISVSNQHNRKKRSNENLFNRSLMYDFGFSAPLHHRARNNSFVSHLEARLNSFVACVVDSTNCPTKRATTKNDEDTAGLETPKEAYRPEATAPEKEENKFKHTSSPYILDIYLLTVCNLLHNGVSDGPGPKGGRVLEPCVLYFSIGQLEVEQNCCQRVNRISVLIFHSL